LGNPLYNLILIIVLTLALLLVIPTVAPKAQVFSASSKKDSFIFVVSLVT
ncbi:hypothetical protein PSV09DRAFT_2197318, partial [Bipolaris maydis]